MGRWKVSHLMRHTLIAIAVALATLSSAHATIQIEADNGTVYRLEAVHIPYDHNHPITAEVVNDDGQFMLLDFDCNGHFIPGGGGWRNTPSRSVAAKIAQISCAKAQAMRTSPKSWDSHS